jgi:hypothetical protein
MNGRTCVWCMVVLILATVVSTSLACNIPVFRYALENWVPDPYHAVVISNGPLSETQSSLLKQLEEQVSDESHPVNLNLWHVDLQSSSISLVASTGEERLPDAVLQSWSERVGSETTDAPQLLLLYPQDWDRAAALVPFTASNLTNLVDSPLRQEIATRLLAGQSSVWVLIESNDKARNDAAWETLQSELKRSEGVVELPSRDLIVSDDQYQADVDIELRVEFSAVRLEHGDEREDLLRSMLKGSEPDLAEFDDPIAIPIYGRGRTYFALVGAGINAETVEENGHFICGACSCEVKRDNPGIDVLMAVNWDDKIHGSVMSDIVLPELTGIGDLEVAAVANANAADGMESDLADLAAVPTENQPADPVEVAAVASTEVVTSVDTAALTPEASVETVGLGNRLGFGLAGGVLVAVGALAVLSFWLSARGV